MVEGEISILEAVSESCIDFSQPSVIVKDVLLTDDASFDFSGDFSLLLTEATASPTLSSFESEEADGDKASRGVEEDLPTSADATTASPAQSTVQVTEGVNDEGGSAAGLVQNSGVERLDNVQQFSTDVVNELDRDSNHKAIVSPWVPRWKTHKALTNGRHTKEASNYQGANSSALTTNHSSNVYKYWIQRFHLFSKFSAGVKLDEEGWFSVTPEIIAKHHAARCNNRGVIVDAFLGMGGNAIQFALAGHYVIAIDKDPRKIEYAHHNASIYGVADRIDFLLGDFFIVSSSLQADVVFLDPPWGGPEYLNVDVYDIQTMMQPKNGTSIFSVAHAIAPNVIFFLPRNVSVEQLAELSRKSTPHLTFEVERNYLHGKLKGVTAYYGHFAGPD